MKKSLKTWLIILGVIALVIVVPLLSNGNSYLKKISYTEFKTILTSEDYTMVYIGSKNCSHCQNMKSVLTKVHDSYNTNINYLDYEKLTAEQVKEISALDIKLAEWGTPTFIFIKGGEIINIQVGEIAEEDFLTLYADAYAYVVPVYYQVVTADNFIKYWESKSTDVFVIGQSSCGHCTNFKPVINKMAKENDVKIYYLEFDLLSEEDREKVINLDKRFDSFGTPLTLIVKKDKILDEISGETSYENLYATLKENKLVD